MHATAPGGRTIRGGQGHFGARQRVLSQSEAIRAILLEYSPCCEGPAHLRPHQVRVRRLFRPAAAAFCGQLSCSGSTLVVQWVAQSTTVGQLVLFVVGAQSTTVGAQSTTVGQPLCQHLSCSAGREGSIRAELVKVLARGVWCPHCMRWCYNKHALQTMRH